MTSHRKKSKFTVYLDPDVTQALADFAARRDQSQSMIAEAAIASFLSPDAAERRSSRLLFGARPAACVGERLVDADE